MTIEGTYLFISINLKVLRTTQEIQNIHRKTFPTVIFELCSRMLPFNTLIFKAYI